MPRDANGNYTLPAGNPVASGTLITSTWANDSMSDLANEMTDSLSRTGKGGLTGPVGIVDKSGAVPGLNFTAEPTSGLKREGAGDVRIQVQGQDKLQCQGSGPVRVDNGAGFQPVAVEPTDRKVMYGEGGITVAYFYAATAPPGWTIEEPDTNIRALFIGPAAGGGVIGGTQDPTDQSTVIDFSNASATIGGATEGHVLTPAQTPTGHERNARRSDTDSSAGASSVKGLLDNTRTNFNQAHSHNLTPGNAPIAVTGTQAVTLTPYYARGILARLDA